MITTWILPVACVFFLLEGRARACQPGASPNVGCPDLVGDANFDLAKFEGEWYTVYTSDQSVSKATKCARMNFGKLSDGLLAQGTSLTSDTSKEAAPTATKYTQDASAKYKFQQSTASSCGYKATDFPTQTILTDYKTYAMVYSCVLKDGQPIEQGVLLSRTSSISDEIKNQTTAGTRFELYPVTQTGCKC